MKEKEGLLGKEVEEVEEETEDLKFVFSVTAKAAARKERNRLRNLAKNKPVAGKTTPRTSVADNTRDDGEPSDHAIGQWRGEAFARAFQFALKGDTLVKDLGEPTIVKSFSSLDAAVKARGGSKRGTLAVVKYLAKNLRSLCAQLKLPTTNVSMRRVLAYKETFLDKMKGLLLPEGSTPWILLSDSFDDFEVDVHEGLSVVQIELFTDSGEDTFTFRKDVVASKVKNLKILAAIKEATDE